MRSETAELCAALARVDEECFKQWRYLFDERGHVRPDEAVASQVPLHGAAEQLRAWCLADCGQAEAERLELLRNQAEREISCEAEIMAHRSAAGRQVIRQAWNNERWRILGWRDALTIGLGWPHRGELVTVDGWCYASERGEVPVPGTAGIYLDNSDTDNVGHGIWVLSLEADRREGSRRVEWEPHEH